MVKKQEEFTNRALALLLREQGLDADYEQRSGRKKLDVVVQVEGLRVVLEAETGYQRRAQAIREADARLRQQQTTAAFAVYYPEDVTEDNLPQATLNWTLRIKPGEPNVQWVLRRTWRSWLRPSGRHPVLWAAPTSPPRCSPTPWTPLSSV